MNSNTTTATTPIGAALHLLDAEVADEANYDLAVRMREVAVAMLADDMVAEAGRLARSDVAADRIKAGYLRLTASLVRSPGR